MRRLLFAPFLLAIAVAGALAAPALAGVNGFHILNKSGTALSAVSVRRVGDSEWTPFGLGVGPGESVRVGFADPDCAFDVRASLAGVGPVVWSGINLCDVKRVTLNRDLAGRTWADYD